MLRHSAEAQQGERVYRVGVLYVGRPPAPEQRVRSPFYGTMKELGWVEGRNVAFEDRHSLTVEPLQGMADELVRLKVDVIFAWGTPPTLAAKRATSNIPIVMLVGTDPVAEGLVASLPRPGGNITGVTAINRELGVKRLELLKEIVPGISRLALLYNPTNPGNVPAVDFSKPMLTMGVTPLLLPEDLTSSTARSQR